MTKRYITNSQAVKELLGSFNKLSASEQEEVLDIIYDALYHKSYKAVIRDRCFIEKDHTIKELNIKLGQKQSVIDELLDKIDRLGMEIVKAQQGNKKKTLRDHKKGLLIIIYNLKHYLGDKWDTIFPNGSSDVDKFLDMVDGWGLKYQKTWEKYENN